MQSGKAPLPEEALGRVLGLPWPARSWGPAWLATCRLSHASVLHPGLRHAGHACLLSGAVVRDTLSSFCPGRSEPSANRTIKSGTEKTTSGLIVLKASSVCKSVSRWKHFFVTI